MTFISTEQVNRADIVTTPISQRQPCPLQKKVQELQLARQRNDRWDVKGQSDEEWDVWEAICVPTRVPRGGQDARANLDRPREQ